MNFTWRREVTAELLRKMRRDSMLILLVWARQLRCRLPACFLFGSVCTAPAALSTHCGRWQRTDMRATASHSTGPRPVARFDPYARRLVDGAVGACGSALPRVASSVSRPPLPQSRGGAWPPGQRFGGAIRSTARWSVMAFSPHSETFCALELGGADFRSVAMSHRLTKAHENTCAPCGAGW